VEHAGVVSRTPCARSKAQCFVEKADELSPGRPSWSIALTLLDAIQQRAQAQHSPESSRCHPNFSALNEPIEVQTIDQNLVTFWDVGDRAILDHLSQRAHA
jgi:hypothetical protein